MRVINPRVPSAPTTRSRRSPESSHRSNAYPEEFLRGTGEPVADQPSAARSTGSASRRNRSTVGVARGVSPGAAGGETVGRDHFDRFHHRLMLPDVTDRGPEALVETILPRVAKRALEGSGGGGVPCAGHPGRAPDGLRPRRRPPGVLRRGRCAARRRELPGPPRSRRHVPPVAAPGASGNQGNPVRRGPGYQGRERPRWRAPERPPNDAGPGPFGVGRPRSEDRFGICR